MIVPPGKDSDTDATPLEAPPAYDNFASSSRQAAPRLPEKSRLPGSPLSPVSPSSSAIRSRVVQKDTWTQLGDNMGELMTNLGLGSTKHRVTKEVRNTVTGLIHDLVRNQTIDTNLSCVGILESCSEVCAAQGINMPSLLQQTNIEGHTLLYWAIVNRPADASEASSSELPPLVRELLAYSAPLLPATVIDVRLACLHTCDQWLFQNLRCSPDFPALSQKEQLLLGVSVPPDAIVVEAPPRYDAPFTVNFEFASFQKRMRVAHGVSLSFISHARMWELSFFVAECSQEKLNAGQWAASITLCDNSPQTDMAAALTINQVTPPADDAEEEVLHIDITGKLKVDRPLHAALPDVFLYPQNPFLTAEGALRGKVVIQLHK